jgi:hypothetical protein
MLAAVNDNSLNECGMIGRNILRFSCKYNHGLTVAGNKNKHGNLIFSVRLSAMQRSSVRVCFYCKDGQLLRMAAHCDTFQRPNRHIVLAAVAFYSGK